MKILIHLTMTLALVLNAQKLDRIDVREDMVHFDQAFIPLWAYTRDGNAQKAKAAVFYLEFQWQRLRGKQQNARPDEAWQEAFARINDWLGDAYYAVDANNLIVAYNQLEYVRYELQELRRSYHIDYYPDHLYAFNDELDMLVDASNDEMLGMMEWPEFEEQATAALQHWRTLMLHPFDAGLYELETDEERMLREYQVDMEAALIDFQRLIEKGDREAVAAGSAQLEDAFLPIIRLFGNFEASHAYYAAMN